MPVAGAVRVPLRYFQSSIIVSGALVVYRPTQSVVLPGPFAMVTDTAPPIPIVRGVTVTVGVVCARSVRDEAKTVKNTASAFAARVRNRSGVITERMWLPHWRQASCPGDLRCVSVLR